MDLFVFVPDMSPSTIHQRTPRVVHNCRVPTAGDELENWAKGSTFFAKIRRWFLRKRILSRKHPFTLWCLRSTTAINYEINRHLTTHPYMIHPFSSFRIFWESTMVVFSFIALLIIPVLLAFYYEEMPGWHVYSDTMNFIFLCDIVVWFFTGYYDYKTKAVVLDPTIVARKYLSRVFWIDLLAALPAELFATLFLKSYWQCAILNLMKIFRMRAIIVYSRRLRFVYRTSFQLYKMLEMGVIIIMAVHWAACMEYFVPVVVSKIFGESTESWILSDHMKAKETRRQKYYTCLNRAIIALVHSGHFLTVITPEDIILDLILTVLGSLGFIYILAEFLKLMTTFDPTTRRHLNTMQQLQEYMRYKELPDFLQRRLMTYYEFRSKKDFEADQRIIAQVSPYLREELILHNYTALINSVEIFKHVPEPVVSQLTAAVETVIHLTNDVIVRAGSEGEALYFIASGTVAVYNNMEKEVCHLEDGAHFGEVALVMEKEHRVATIIAVETCLMYVLYRAQFQRAIAPYPDLLTRLQNVVLECLAKIPSIDEACMQDKILHFSNINISNIRGKRKDTTHTANQQS